MKIHRFKRRGVIRRFHQWCVSVHGVENLTGPCRYDIGKAVLGHPWWSGHMRDKRWVNGTDFDKALDFAREHFGVKIGGDVLW